ncbi:hypothetical protein WMF38_57220 [Sorangium sp. So ce118]
MSIGTIVTGLGRAIVSWGFGGGDSSNDFPARIRIPALNDRFHIGDTVPLEGILVKNLAGVLVEPVSFTVVVQPEVGSKFSLVWGSVPEDGAGDAIVQTATGTFTVQIEVTAERGTGLYEFAIVTTGARAAEDGSFRVLPRLM